MKNSVLKSLALLFALTGWLISSNVALSNEPHDPPKPSASVAATPPFYSVKALQTYLETLKKQAKEKAKENPSQGQQEVDTTTAIKNEEGEHGLDYLEALIHYLHLRAYPNDTVDWTAYLRASAHRDRMAPQFMSASGEQWEFMGPRNMSPPDRLYFGIGPISGRVNALAYDPVQEGVYYCGSAQGGLLRSTDFGQTWVSLSNSWSILSVSSIAIHPTNSNIIYAGTGDFQGWMRPVSVGIMRSTDGGNTWTALGQSTFGGRCISDIKIDPENPNIIVVATGWGPYVGQTGSLWRSTDGGDSWQQVNSTPAIWADMTVGALNQGNGQRYYYAVGYSTNRDVWRSSDRGQTWTKLTTPLSTSFQNALRIAASLTNPDTVYLMSGSEGRLWKSTNAGATWTSISVLDGGFYQSWYDAHLHVSTRPVSGHPVDVIYVGTVDLVQSTNGGANWTNLSQGFTQSARFHIDQHAFAINPRNPNEALAGSDGGVYRLLYNPTTNSTSITSLNANLGITQFYWADFHPTQADRMLGGAQDNSTCRATGNLNSWSNVVGGDGGYPAYHPQNTNIQYACAQGLYVVRTTNDWATSNEISPNTGDPVAFIAPLMIDPNTPTRVYAGSNYLLRWNETTQSWTTRVGNQRLSTSGTVSAIAVAPGDSNRIYTGSTDGEVWMTTNAGTNWTRINTGNPSLPNRAITDIAVDPTDPSRIYVVVGGTGTGHAWKCDNTQAGTRVWINISGSGTNALPDIHANTVAVDPARPQHAIFVGNDVGVFYTTDGGATWLNGTAPLGLPNVQVNRLKVNAVTGYLNAASYGRGAWRIPLSFTAQPGDVDGNGCVDDADLSAVIFAFGQTGANLPEDLNHDGTVDDADLAEVIFNFGTGC